LTRKQLTLVPRPLAKTESESVPAPEPVPPEPRPEYHLDAGSASGGWWVRARLTGGDWRAVAWIAAREEADRYIERLRAK
jgi:hypothetical protein